MNWATATFWIHEGQNWHALRGHPNSRDLSMGALKPWEVERIMAWCRMHKLEIIDERGA